MASTSSVERLARRLRDWIEEALCGAVESSQAWGGEMPPGWSGRPGDVSLAVVFRRRGSADAVAVYHMVPWQPLFLQDSLAPPSELLTVTKEALVFATVPLPDVAEAEAARRAAAEVLDAAANEEDLPPNEVGVPEGVQAIRVSVRRYYAVFEVAVPGTHLPCDDALRAAAPGRMIRLVQIPDMGRVRTRWLVAEKPSPKICELPGDPTFGDYQPKTTPDTVLDYRPSLRTQVEALPPADLAFLDALLDALDAFRKRAQRKPGRWVEGNMVLGAAPKEYEPSDDELLESETGRRIRGVVAVCPPADTAAALDRMQRPLAEVRYRGMEFTHLDVMGSGRFFYVSPPAETVVILRK